MKKIVFHTNVDEYQRNCWPAHMEVIPRKGETIYVNDEMKDYYRGKKLPIRMEVVDVCYSEKEDKTPLNFVVGFKNEYYTLVEVELWFKKVDHEFMKLNKT